MRGRKILLQGFVTITTILMISMIVFVWIDDSMIVEQSEEVVRGRVTKKEHENSKKNYSSIGISYIVGEQPERFLVEVSYKEKTETFDNSYLYNTFKEGDIIEVVYYKAYNKKGRLVDEGLRLP